MFPALLAAVLGPAAPLAGEPPGITSFGANGELTFSCVEPNQSYCVEWASSPEGPWHDSWMALASLEPGEASSLTVAVPMFYRVRSPALVQSISLISATDAGTLIRDHQGSAHFVILDVRLDSVVNFYGHISGAINLDYRNEPLFTQILGILDRNKTYLVHCTSGSLSRRTVSKMQELGFLHVYDLQGGFSAFKAIAANADLID